MADEVVIPIDDNVPIPKLYESFTISPYTKALQALEVGQSFIVHEAEIDKAKNSAARMKVRYPEKTFTRRKQDDFYRYWRIK